MLRTQFFSLHWLFIINIHDRDNIITLKYSLFQAIVEVINSKGAQLLSHNTMIILDTIWTKGSSFHLTKAICQQLEAKTKMTSGSGYHVLFGPAKQFLRKLKFLRIQY